jgi:transmembrane sensor
MLGEDDAVDPFVWGVIDSSAQSDAAVESNQTVGELDDIVAEASQASNIGGRRFWMSGAIAASLILVAFTSIIWQDHPEPQTIRTELGQVAEVPLADSSVIVVNTKSRLEVMETANTRSVRLDEGEAWFKVAKDPDRPFLVESGEVRVQALGTSFAVRRREHGTDVQVTEGVVEVWSSRNAADRTRIMAGARTFVHNDSGARKLVQDASDVERSLSWRSGWLTFQGSTLEDAVEEFNRYNVTKLEIAPALADEKIVGRFRSSRPDSFAHVVSLTFDARVYEEGKRIRVVPQ